MMVLYQTVVVTSTVYFILYIIMIIYVKYCYVAPNSNCVQFCMIKNYFKSGNVPMLTMELNRKLNVCHVHVSSFNRLYRFLNSVVDPDPTVLSPKATRFQRWESLIFFLSPVIGNPQILFWSPLIFISESSKR